MEFVYFSILSEIRFGGHFLAPPAGSVFALRAPQGQSRKKMITSPLLIKIVKINKFHMGMGNTGRVCLRPTGSAGPKSLREYPINLLNIY